MVNGDDRLARRILYGRSSANIRFNDLVAYLRRLGFKERIKGSHHIFYMDGIRDQLNLQPLRGQAKAYQVQQVRRYIDKHNILRGE